MLQFQEEGFYLLGETSLSVDEQVVYTSEADPLTGESIQKPMTVTGQLVDELGRNLSFRNVKVDYEMLGSQLGIRTCLPLLSEYVTILQKPQAHNVRYLL